MSMGKKIQVPLSRPRGLKYDDPVESKSGSSHWLFPREKARPAVPGERATLRGTIARVTYQNPEGPYTVARLEGDGLMGVTVVGGLYPISQGEEVQVSGLWKMHPRYGLQFEVERWQKIEPATLEGIERYLGSGLIKGLGPAFARRLVSRFGLDTLRVLSQEPRRLLEVEGIGRGRWKKILDAWEKQKGTQEAMVFLQGHGVSSALALRIYRALGPDTISKVRANPYSLAYDVNGIGFIIADRIAQALEVKRDAPLRVEAGVLHVLQKFSEQGHCFVPLHSLKANAAALLGSEVEEAGVEDAVRSLAGNGRVVVEETDFEGSARVYPRQLYQAEVNVACSVRGLLTTPSSLSSAGGTWTLEEGGAPLDLFLEEKQRDAVLQGVTHKVSIITGGPGTGKTTLLVHLLRLFRNRKVSFALAAPTGRAAKRMGEMTGEEAKTIHRLLEYNPRTGGFQRHGKTPLDVDVVIIDEASMVDVTLMDHLLRAVRPESHLLLIGDVDQLPSVGPGHVLQDMIESGVVPVVVLSHIFRQTGESLIVVNAHRILRGENLELGKDRPDADFIFIQRESQEDILRTVKELVKERIPRLLGAEPSQSVQVLSPMNRGVLGTINLNQELQGLLNPGGRSVEGAAGLFRLGDKVMQLRNNYDKGVFNGDLGWIRDVNGETEKIAVDFDGIRLGYGVDELDELGLAYATSVHKSQGSEYPAVVIPLHTAHYPMLHRSILYTAVTRGKKLVVLVGSQKALWMAVRNVRVERRFTALREKLTVR